MTGIRWRDTYRTPRIFIFDARLAAFWMAPALHFRFWTMALALFATFILFFFEVRRRMSLESAGRWIKSRLLGVYRRGHPQTRRWGVDYGRPGRNL